MPTHPPRPLVITADPVVLDDLIRIGLTAGTEVDVATDAGAARRSWGTAAAVVIGPDAAVACARARLPRRSGVALLGEDLDDAGIWQRAVEVGAEHVVFLPDGEAWLVEMLAESVEPSRISGELIAVVGGRGGAGATTLAAGLAVTASRRGHGVLLVDGDPLGGGIDLVFGGESDPGVRWPDLGGTRGRLPGAALTEALPRMSELSVLSWDRGDVLRVPPEAMEAVLEAGRRACELVVADLPRALDEASRIVLSLATVVLLVVPAEVRAAAAATRVATQLSPLCHDLRLVVRGPSPSGLAADEIAGALGLPLVGFLKPEPGIDLALERGEPPARRGRSPLALLCQSLLDDVLPLQRAA
ncbi:MAG: CpaE-like family protein [Frankiaceae bacterium]|nr:CpaE-like family protein [Frankiaceae bacterium]